MGINIADNFAYNGKKPMDNRTEYNTLSAMKSVVDANINEGCICYNKEDGKYYTFKSTNTVDATTGKWREFETGGGGQTYNDFTGATASTAGAHGLVPAPSAGDEGKVLFGNGAWGNIVMPSVDLSNSSVESDILDTTEKAIGTTTDNKLIYQKVVSTGGSAPSGTTLLIRIAMLNGTDIIRYTKNSESALPSGVKFAGVWYDGSVILEKTYVLSSPITVTNSGVDITSYIDNFASISRYIDARAYNDTYIGTLNLNVYVADSKLFAVTDGNYPVSKITLKFIPS